MQVHNLMSTAVIAVGPKTPVREVLQLMLRYRLNNVLIVDHDRALLGIVTYSDLSRRLLPTYEELSAHEEYLQSSQSMEDRFVDRANTPVEEVMTRNVITATPELEALKAGATMLAHRIKQLPVVQDHKIVGIISHSDIGWGLMMRYAERIRG
jgi:CBS domain-containing protein